MWRKKDNQVVEKTGFKNTHNVYGHEEAQEEK